MSKGQDAKKQTKKAPQAGSKNKKSKKLKVTA